MKVLQTIEIFKVNNRNTKIRCEICSKLTRKTPKRRQWRFSCVFIINFEQISHLFLVFLLLTLSRYTQAGKLICNQSSINMTNIVTHLFQMLHFYTTNAANIYLFKVNNRNTKKVGYLFKVNSKDTRCYYWLWTYFTPFSSVSIADFVHVFICWEKFLGTNGLKIKLELDPNCYFVQV